MPDRADVPLTDADIWIDTPTAVCVERLPLHVLAGAYHVTHEQPGKVDAASFNAAIYAGIWSQDILKPR